MKRPLALILLSCVAGAVLSAPGGSLKRTEVSANPAWLLHMDLDALRQTYIGKYILFQLDKPEVHSKMAAFQAFFSFDIRTQIHGVTVYSEGPTTSDNVVFIYADFDPARLIALANAGEGPQTSTNNQHVIYSWIEKRNTAKDDKPPRNYAIIESGRVIKSFSKERLISALAVIDGIAPNLSTSAAVADLACASDAAFLQGTARNLDFLGTEPNAALLKMSKRVKLEASETDGILNATLIVDAGDEYTAKQMSTAAQGLIALLSLQKDNPRAAKLADGLSVKHNGTTLTGTVAVPSKDLMAALKAYMAQKENAKARAD